MARRKPSSSGSGVYVPDGMGGRPGMASIGMAACIQPADIRLKAISDTRRRMVFVTLAFFAAFAMLGVRLVSVTLTASEDTIDNGATALSFTRERGDLVDRNGEVLATNLLSSSLYADLDEVWNPEETARELRRIIPEFDQARLLRQLKSDRRYVQLMAYVTPKQKQAIFALGLPGIEFPRRERRVYPRGSDAAHVIGYVDSDNIGISGVELGLDELIVTAGKTGRAVTLSLDMRIQHVLQDELAKSMEMFSAAGAAGVIVDATNGEVLALSSLPDFDPNNPTAFPERHRFNQVTKGIYEMGSVLKMFTLAMALDSGSVTLTDGYDTSKPLHIASHTIKDFHGEERWLTVPEILVYSSNIGSAKIAQDVGISYHQEFLRKLGLFERSSIELPEVSKPSVPGVWREIRAATISYGYGIAISPLQLAAAASALVNGGVLHDSTILRRDRLDSVDAKQVISPATSRQMRVLLRMVVTDGTGSKADVEGYDVGGKTGTTEKISAGGYSQNALLTSFIAIFPAQNPKYVALIMLDEPHGTDETFGFANAGWTAAPVAGDIIRRIAPIMGIAPVSITDDGFQQAMLNSVL